jgi:hypothetical protein
MQSSLVESSPGCAARGGDPSLWNATPSALMGRIPRDANPGCAAARRPWALEGNAFGVEGVGIQTERSFLSS